MPNRKSIEIIDLQKGVCIQNIVCRFRPELICYLPRLDEVFITSNGGKCYFYNTKNFTCTGTLRLLGQPTAVQYDSAQRKIYVGYEYDVENGGFGAVATIDAEKQKQTNYILLYGPPEKMSINTKSNKLYLNIPSTSELDIVDLEEHKIARTLRPEHQTAIPMAIDTARNRMFLFYPKRSALAIINSKTGRMRTLNTETAQATNIFFDGLTQQLFVQTKGGHLCTFYEEPSGFRQTSEINITGNGLSLLSSRLRLFIVVNHEKKQKKSELFIYKI